MMGDGHFKWDFAAGETGGRTYRDGGDSIENASAERLQRARALATDGWYDESGQQYLQVNQRSHNQNLETADGHRAVSQGWGKAGVECQDALGRACNALGNAGMA
ncbi:hypothetical protein [Amycolatopsis japonica]|uniref:hypothetical protein n=1 Tax=Amycolatopsis japonica TaxID=208439 RepID=UPI0033E62229